jgi:hypothetical protein
MMVFDLSSETEPTLTLYSVSIIYQVLASISNYERVVCLCLLLVPADTLTLLLRCQKSYSSCSVINVLLLCTETTLLNYPAFETVVGTPLFSAV